VPDDVVPLGIDLETGLVTGLSVGIGDAVLVIGTRAVDRTVIARSVCAAIGQCRPSQRVLHIDTSAIATEQGELPDRSAAPGSLTDVVVVSGTGHDIRRREGWWTGLARRARLGVVLDGPDAHGDGELLGVVLPRGFPARSHPHRAWLVDHGSIVPVHVAAAEIPTATDPVSVPLPLTAAWRPLSGTSR
jgi:hypothetical protein